MRDTGLTHMAVRGDSSIVIQWAAGHSSFKMTETYISRGRVEARRIGPPLPRLPSDFLEELPAKYADPGPEGLAQVSLPELNSVAKLLEMNWNFCDPNGN